MSLTELVTRYQAIEHPALDFFTSLFLTISNHHVYYVVLPLIFWCINKQLGFILLYLHASSMYLFHLLKSFFSLNLALSSYPYTLTATTFWGYLLVHVQKRLFTIIAAFLMLLIAFCHLYVSAHWPTDIVGAAIISLFLIFLTVRTFDWFGSLSDIMKLVLCVLMPLFLLAISPEQAQHAGFLLGAGIGYYLEQIKNRMEISPALAKKTLAYIVGMLGVIAISSLKNYLPVSLFTDFLIEASVGVWITYVAPMLFIRLSLYRQLGKISFR